MKPLYKIHLPLLAILTLSLFSCRQKPQERFPGFGEHKDGFYFKRITIGDGTKVPQENDSIYMQMVFTDSMDKAFFNSSGSVLFGVLGFKVGSPGTHLIENALLTMVEGDSTVFKMVADSVYREAFNIELPGEIKQGTLINVQAKMVLHKTAQQIAYEEKQFRKWCQEMQEVEDAQLNNYLKTQHISQSADSNGIYWLSEQKGQGKPVFLLPMAYVYYRGSFLNGKVFDNSYSTGDPLEYIPGKTGQLIKGLELVAGGMKIGGKAKLILPSRLAFGSSGSSTGIVPPFATVIYEIEITDIKKTSAL